MCHTYISISIRIRIFICFAQFYMWQFFRAGKCYAKGLTLVYVALRQSKGMANNLVDTHTQTQNIQTYTHRPTHTQTAQTFTSGNSQPSTSSSFWCRAKLRKNIKKKEFKRQQPAKMMCRETERECERGGERVRGKWVRKRSEDSAMRVLASFSHEAQTYAMLLC